MDRRLVAVAAAVIAVFALAIFDDPATRGSAEPGSAAVDVDVPAMPGYASRPSSTPPAAGNAEPVRPAVNPADPAATTALAAGAVGVPLERLLAAGQPAPDQVTAAAVDDGDGNYVTVSGSAGQIAAVVVVAVWSWRFDDPSGRHAEAFTEMAAAGIVTAGVAAQLTPARGEVERRQASEEVSWVIVTSVTDSLGIVDGDVAKSIVRVEFDRHLLTATAAETVTPAQMKIGVDRVGGRWQAVTVVAGQP